MSLGDFARLPLQGPPVLPDIFCQPVSVGGVGRLSLDSVAWPILVPAEDGVQICYTWDDDFRTTYMQGGFCGLNDSFRSQFPYDCPDQPDPVYLQTSGQEEGRQGAENHGVDEPLQSAQESLQPNQRNEEQPAREPPNEKEGDKYQQHTTANQNPARGIRRLLRYFNFLTYPGWRRCILRVSLVRWFVESVAQCVVTSFVVNSYLSVLLSVVYILIGFCKLISMILLLAAGIDESELEHRRRHRGQARGAKPPAGTVHPALTTPSAPANSSAATNPPDLPQHSGPSSVFVVKPYPTNPPTHIREPVPPQPSRPPVPPQLSTPVRVSMPPRPSSALNTQRSIPAYYTAAGNFAKRVAPTGPPRRPQPTVSSRPTRLSGSESEVAPRNVPARISSPPRSLYFPASQPATQTLKDASSQGRAEHVVPEAERPVKENGYELLEEHDWKYTSEENSETGTPTSSKSEIWGGL